MAAVLKQGPIFKYMDKNRWSDAWFILRRTSTGPEIQLFKDSSAKKALGDAIAIAAKAPAVRFGKTSKLIAKAPECGKDVRLCEEAFIAITHEKTQKRGPATIETVWLCALSTVDMFELLRMIASSMPTSDHETPSPADDDANVIGGDCIPTPFLPNNNWERYWVNPPAPEVPEPVVAAPGKLKKAKSVDALAGVKVEKKNEKNRTPTVTLDDSKLDDRERTDSTTSVLSNTSSAVVVVTGKKGKDKEPKTKEAKPDKKKKNDKNEREVKAMEVVAVDLQRVEELPEEKLTKKEKPKVAPKPKMSKERARSVSSSSISSVEEKPRIGLTVVPGNKNKKDNNMTNGDLKPEVVHAEAQTDSEHSTSPPHRAAINPPPPGYGAVVDQLKSKDAAKSEAKAVPPPIPPPKKQPPPKSSLPSSEDGSSSEDEANFEDALERGQSVMVKPNKNKSGEYSVSQIELTDKEEKIAKHTVVYDQNGHDIEHHSVEIASSRH